MPARRCAATTRMTARRRKLERNRGAAITLEAKSVGADERSLEGWCVVVGRRKVDQKKGNDPRREVARKWGWTWAQTAAEEPGTQPILCHTSQPSSAPIHRSQTPSAPTHLDQHSLMDQHG
jgi:hypothetical protein